VTAVTSPRWVKRSEYLKVLDRLKHLESAPTPADGLDEIRTALSTIELQQASLTTQIDSLFTDVGLLEQQAKDFVLALAEGIERRERADRRIKATVARARAQLRDGGVVDDGLEAEASELREDDGKRGQPLELLPMPPTVDDDRQDVSSIQGVPLSVLQRVRGIG